MKKRDLAILGLLGLSFFGLAARRPGAPHAAAAPDPSQPILKEAQACLQAGDYDCAVENFQKVLEVHPEMAQIHNLLGMAYSHMDGFSQSAIAAFEQAISLKPDFGEPYMNLGMLHASTLQDQETALSYFEKGLQVDPKSARGYFAAAWIYLIGKRDVKKALEYFENAARYAPTFAEAYYGIGLCNLQLQKREMALGPISKLRELHKEELASKLEQVMATGDAAVLNKPEAAVAAAAPAAAKPAGRGFPFGPPRPAAPAQAPQPVQAPPITLPPDISGDLPKE